MRMHDVAIFDLSGCTVFFHNYLQLCHKQRDLKKKSQLNINMCFDLLYDFCQKHFSFKEWLSEI